MKKTSFILPLISFILSIIGIWHALPLHVVGDEEALIGGALKMIELKTLIPSLHPADFASLYYPPLISYLILIAITPVVFVKFVLLGFSTSGLQDYFVLNQNGIWISARILSALFAAGTVAVLFQIAKRLFNEKIAWLSSVFLLTSFFHAVVSHWVRHWTFTTFFVYATILSFIVIPDLIRNPANQNKQKKIFKPFGFLFSFLDSRFYGNDKEVGIRSTELPNYVITRLRIFILPGLLGGLGFGISYLGGLGFFVGLVYAWFKRNEIVYFKKIIVSNIFVFGLLACIFSFLNIQEVYRMISPIDGSLADPKSVEGLFTTFGVIGSILLRQELIISVFGLLGLFVVGRSYRSTVNTIIVWIAFYALLIYGAFHLELRYVYLAIPALCLLAGLVLNQFMDRISSRLWKVVLSCLVFVWPVASIVRYEHLLTRQDTREQAIEWIQKNLRSGEPFMVSSETIVLPRTHDALIQDQEMGRVRAAERYQLQVQSSKFKVQKEFQYYNMHFWSDDLAWDEIESFVQKEQPTHVVVDYWSEDKLSERERQLIDRGKKVVTFSQDGPSPSVNPTDVNGNFFKFNDILFKIDRLGPIVEVIKLDE